jgi:hypothetical protein
LGPFLLLLLGELLLLLPAAVEEEEGEEGGGADGEKREEGEEGEELRRRGEGLGRVGGLKCGKKVISLLEQNLEERHLSVLKHRHLTFHRKT